jgi:chorismate mutase
LHIRFVLPRYNSTREAEQVSRLGQLAVVSKLDPDFVEKFLALVIREVIPPSRIDSAGGALGENV